MLGLMRKQFGANGLPSRLKRALWFALVQHTSANWELHICAYEKPCGAKLLLSFGIVAASGNVLKNYATRIGAALRIADSEVQFGELADIEVELPLTCQH